MSEHDRRLIERANNVPPQWWYMIDDMIPKAEDPETREELRSIRRRLYHRDEYEADLL